MLRWTLHDLAAAANVGIVTVRRAEAGDDVPNLHTNNLLAITRALEAAGIEFTDGEAPGVRMRPR